MFESLSPESIEAARRILAKTSPIHRCPYCRQYGCSCPGRVMEDLAADRSTYEDEEDELKLSGEPDEVIINPKLGNNILDTQG